MLSCGSTRRVSIFHILLKSSTPNFPFHIFDADLLLSLLVVVKPIALRQVNIVELGAGFNAVGEPVSLDTQDKALSPDKTTR